MDRGLKNEDDQMDVLHFPKENKCGGEWEQDEKVSD